MQLEQEHAALQVEDAGGQIAGLTHGIGKRRADEGLGLLLDHGEKPIPHQLIVYLREG